MKIRRMLTLFKKEKREVRKVKFIFDDTNGKAKNLSLEFITSNEKKFDSNVRLLKLMAREEEPEE